MKKSVILGIFITLVSAGLLFFAAQSFAAMPTLQDILAYTPRPVLDFFHKLEALNSGDGSDLISRNLPVIGKPIAGFLNVVWELILILLKGVGSIFVWIFHAIASGLESLILG